MYRGRWLAYGLVWVLGTLGAVSQQNRVPYNGQHLFLSGANLAWVRFASDIGAGPADRAKFADVMQHMHDHGGNTLRWWLHTNGAITPEFSASDAVSGPGSGTIRDIKQVLDLAWEREIGVTLCLWSFDMLSSSNKAAVLRRNLLLVNDTAYTQAYIRNCLIPMVDSLKGHPAILAWEIINEPEGMSSEFGWNAVEHVPMSVIQRFVNMCAGAIHTRDPKALVTCGSWAFYSLTDVPGLVLAKTGAAPVVTIGEKQEMETRFAEKYGMALSADEIIEHYRHAAARPAYNYYRDDRLIAAGGDPLGVLDFYSVHYYDWGGTLISPFHHPKAFWQLEKPLVVAEFALRNTFNVPKENLYDMLYRLGYAGALAWSWTDAQLSSSADMLGSMQAMWDAHKADVDVKGVGGGEPPDDASSAPALRFALEQNFPNPFNPITTIPYALAEPGAVVIALYDVLGRKVATLVDEQKPAGSFRVKFDARRLPSGVYVCRMTVVHGAGIFTATRRSMVMK